jgi:NAD(P)-dependent dehydrogenase (short-subunit alcohol dehydrogenase family)
MILGDKVILLAGVGRGLGRKLALQAAAEGAHVVLAARSADFLEEVAREVRERGGRALAVPSDLTKPADCAALAEKTVQTFGQLDGLVNIAYGITGFGLFEQADLSSWRAAMDITLFGPLNLIQAALPYLKKSKGAIVNIGSISTRAPLEQHGPNMIPKAALMAATRQLALELGRYGIRVNNVVFGWLWGAPVENHLIAEAKAAGVPLESLIADVAKRIPLGRIPPDERCAKTILMLLSDYASEATGASLDVNGGMFLPL